MRQRLGVGVTFDVIERGLEVGGKKAACFFVDGFLKDKVTADALQQLQRVERADSVPNTIKKLLEKTVSYFETDTVETLEEAIEEVLSGPMVLFIDGERQAIVLDLREYPVRGIAEPELERVTRGSHEGFVETIVFNTAMIRRRLRDPALRFEVQQVGLRSKTDVAIAYIEDLADASLVAKVKRRVADAKIDALPMGARNLEEMVTLRPWNPIPRVRYTERPDVVAAHLLEGHVIILVDTTPMAMIVPVTIFHFFEHAEEFFQSPVIGTYLRWIRAIAFGVAALLGPLWLALYMSQDILPDGLRFLGPREADTAVPIPLQFVFLEFGIDLIRMALIHTPSALATSLGIVGAILLGELAVEVGLFIPETILYMSVVAIGYFAVPSIEFGYAIRLFRYLLLALVIPFGLIGFFAGLIIGFVVLATSRSIDTPYLWPLIPFNGKALTKALIRFPSPSVSSRPEITVRGKSDDTRVPKSRK